MFFYGGNIEKIMYSSYTCASVWMSLRIQLGHVDYRFAGIQVAFTNCFLLVVFINLFLGFSLWTVTIKLMKLISFWKFLYYEYKIFSGIIKFFWLWSSIFTAINWFLMWLKIQWGKTVQRTQSASYWSLYTKTYLLRKINNPILINLFYK